MTAVFVTKTKGDGVRVQPWGAGMSPQAMAAIVTWRAANAAPAEDEPEPEPVIPPGKGLHVALAIDAAYAARPPLPVGQGMLWRSAP